jgi:hypothetical protein
VNLRTLVVSKPPYEIKKTTRIKHAPGAHEIQKSVWQMKKGKAVCCMFDFMHIYSSALKMFFFRIPISSLYEATKNELQDSGMAISKKIDDGPRSH